MRIKNAEGQTLLTLMKLTFVFLACLIVGPVQTWADATFYFISNAESMARSFIYRDEVEEDPAIDGRLVELYYSYAQNGGAVYVYEPYYLIGDEGAMGLTDSNGQVLVDEKYEDILVLPAAYVLKQGGSWSFVDRQTLAPLSADLWHQVQPDRADSGLLASNLVLVERDGLFGAVDLTGQVIIQPKYEDFHIYSYAAPWQLIRVRQEGLWGFIDLTGAEVVPARYDYVLLDTVVVYEDENDAEGAVKPIIYVLKDGDWGGVFRDARGQAKAVDWEIEPTEEVLSDYESQV